MRLAVQAKAIVQARARVSPSDELVKARIAVTGRVECSLAAKHGAEPILRVGVVSRPAAEGKVVLPVVDGLLIVGRVHWAQLDIKPQVVAPLRSQVFGAPKVASRGRNAERERPLRPVAEAGLGQERPPASGIEAQLVPEAN